MLKFTKTTYVDVETGVCYQYNEIKGLLFKRLRKEIKHEENLGETLVHTLIEIKFYKTQQTKLF